MPSSIFISDAHSEEQNGQFRFFEVGFCGKVMNKAIADSLLNDFSSDKYGLIGAETV